MGICTSRTTASFTFMGFNLSGQNHPRTLAKDTYFTEDEVYALFELFKSVSSTIIADGLIHKDEFCMAIFKSSKSNKFMDRVFVLFDAERNGVISFGEFVRGLSVFHPLCPLTEKTIFAFRIYDLFDTGTIKKSEVRTLLVSTLKHSKTLHLPDAVIDALIDRTFLDLGSTDTIDMKEFTQMVTKDPSVINYMTLPILRDLTTKFPSFAFNKTSNS